MIAFPLPSQMCWICGKLVELETCKADEYGTAVHGRCYVAKMALAHEAQMSVKNQQAQRANDEDAIAQSQR